MVLRWWLIGVVWVGAFSAASQFRTIEELKADAEAVLQKDNISARARVGVVFLLAQRLVADDRLNEAAGYYDRGLRINPQAFAEHAAYAELLKSLRKPELARRHAQIVLKSCEDPALLVKAMTVLNQEMPVVEPLGAISADGPLLVLIPVGELDLLLVEEERARLAGDLGIEVLIRSIELQLPVPARDERARAAQKVRELVRSISQGDPEAYERALSRLKWSTEDLREDSKILELYPDLLKEQKGDQAAQEWRQQLDWVSRHGKQWSAEAIMDVLAPAVKPFGGENVRFLAVTSADVFMRDTNFVFGYARRTNAIMSYRRFTADFNGETPSRPRLLRRTHFQCLASAGHVFGVKRCSDPSCPRAYPNGLADHDAKSDNLCGACQEGFDTAFAPHRTR